MAADWVTLFDLDLAKAVVRLDRPGLARFIAEESAAFVERDQRSARVRAAEHVAYVRERQAAVKRAAREAELSDLLRELEEHGCGFADDF